MNWIIAKIGGLMVKVDQSVKRIKFVRSEVIYEGDYLGKKRYGNMAGLSKGRTYYKVRVVFSEEEFSIFTVDSDEVVELIY